MARRKRDPGDRVGGRDWVNLPTTRIYVYRGFLMYAIPTMVEGGSWLYITVFGAHVVRDVDE